MAQELAAERREAREDLLLKADDEDRVRVVLRRERVDRRLELANDLRELLDGGAAAVVVARAGRAAGGIGAGRAAIGRRAVLALGRRREAAEDLDALQQALARRAQVLEVRLADVLALLRLALLALSDRLILGLDGVVLGGWVTIIMNYPSKWVIVFWDGTTRNYVNPTTKELFDDTS